MNIGKITKKKTDKASFVEMGKKDMEMPAFFGTAQESPVKRSWETLK